MHVWERWRGDILMSGRRRRGLRSEYGREDIERGAGIEYCCMIEFLSSVSFRPGLCSIYQDTKRILVVLLRARLIVRLHQTQTYTHARRSPFYLQGFEIRDACERIGV